MIFFLLILHVHAEVQSLLGAQDSREIVRFHQMQVRQKLLRARCDVELQQQWMPDNCFEWLQSAPLTASEKQQWTIHLKKKCEHAVQKATAEGKEELLFKKKKVLKVCFESLEPAFLNWRYRLSSTAQVGLKDLENIEQIGKDFEGLRQHELESQKNNRRISNRSAFGRRLN